MRYQARFSNGAWKLFDSHAYEDLDIFDRQIEAEAAAGRANERAALRRGARR